MIQAAPTIPTSEVIIVDLATELNLMEALTSVGGSVCSDGGLKWTRCNNILEHKMHSQK